MFQITRTDGKGLGARATTIARAVEWIQDFGQTATEQALRDLAKQGEGAEQTFGNLRFTVKFEQNHWDTGASAREHVEQDATITDGVPRWKSSGNIVPEDIVDEAIAQGIEGIDPAAIRAERDQDLDQMRKRMIKAEKNMSDEARAEQAFEMRAAFGPGVEVVNVITGGKTRT